MRILVVLDDPSEHDQQEAVAYAAGLIAGQEQIEVHLLLVLPPTPSEFLEYGSLDEMKREAIANATHQGAHVQWLDTVVAQAHPTMARARQILEEAGVPTGSIHEHYDESTHSRHVAQHALDVARECGCDTIAMTHKHLAWYQRWGYADPASELLRKVQGLTLWFVS
jgi:nucleotide-binding universal stress UspA family protein